MGSPIQGEPTQRASEESPEVRDPSPPSIFTGSTTIPRALRSHNVSTQDEEDSDEEDAYEPRSALSHQPWRDQLQMSPPMTWPDPNRPNSTSSYGSTLSFFGAHQDQSSPMGNSPLSPPARRSGGLGPPPSARRGPWTYYSQSAFVTPIQEETDSRHSKQSSTRRASWLSAVHSTHERSEGYARGTEDHRDDIDGTERQSNGATRSSDIAPRSSTFGISQIPEASHRIPTLTSAHSRLRSGNSSAGHSSQNSNGDMIELPTVTSRTSTASSSQEDIRSLLQSHVQNANSTSNAIDRHVRLATSQQTLVNHGPPVLHTYAEGSQAAHAAQADIDKILGGLKGAGMLDEETAEHMRNPRDTYTGFANKGEPNVAVRDISDSSSESEDQHQISGKIIRATSMAADIDRGLPVLQQDTQYTRLDSPVDMEKPHRPRDKKRGTVTSEYVSQSQPRSKSKSKSRRRTEYNEKSHHHHSTSKSNPNRSWLDLSTSRIDFRLRPPRGTAQSTYSRHGHERRICGLPRWGFFITAAVVTVCTIIAVVVPVAVLGIGQNKDPASVGNCFLPSAQACLNGGVSMLSADGSCNCVCTSGFTGTRCEEQSDTGCVTAKIGDIKKASVGSRIAPLLEQAGGLYSIPLNGQVLLGLFAAANLTCSTENALVVFQGQGLSRRAVSGGEAMAGVESEVRKPWLRFFRRQRRGPEIAAAAAVSIELSTQTKAPVATSAVGVVAAAVVASSAVGASSSIASPISSSQIIGAASTPASSVMIPTSTPIAAPIASTSPPLNTPPSTSSTPPLSTTPLTSKLSSSTTTPSSPSSPSTSALATATPTTNPLTFAKIAVLYILQDSHDLPTAVTAQSQLQQFFTSVLRSADPSLFTSSSGLGSMTGAKNVSLGGSGFGYWVDFERYTLKLRNGTVYGAGFNGTAGVGRIAGSI